MRNALMLGLLSWAGLLASAGPALADKVHLKNGRVLEGEVRDDGDALVVKKRGGIEARVPKDQVVRVETSATPEQTYQERLAGLQDDDLRGHQALARWCDEQKLEPEARAVRERILGRWPDDEAARRGLGYVKHEGRWLTREEYMVGLGLVPADDGKTWVGPEEAARRARAAEAKAQAAEVRRLLRQAATAADVAPVVSALQGYQDDAAVPVLAAHVTDDSLKVRLVAIDELGRRKVESAARRLAEAVVEDPSRAARSHALNALTIVAKTPALKEAAGAYFVRALGREHLFHVVHAAAALPFFAHQRAVPGLINVLRESTAGFGRVHFSQITQRAYISDYQLSSGGTGNVVAEVADPTIATFQEGTVLDVQVVQWWREAIVGSLRRITGQRFGADPGEWERWWREQGR